MTFAAMLLFGSLDNSLNLIGSGGIAALMLAAQGTHLRSGTQAFRRLPSLVWNCDMDALKPRFPK